MAKELAPSAGELPDQEVIEINSDTQSAKAWLEEIGIDDLSQIEYAHLRHIVKECKKQEDRLEEDEKIGHGIPKKRFLESWHFEVGKEAAHRWLLEELGLEWEDVYKKYLVRDPITGEESEYEMGQNAEMQRKVLELEQRYKDRFSQRDWDDLTFWTSNDKPDQKRVFSVIVPEAFKKIVKRMRGERVSKMSPQAVGPENTE